MQKTRKTTYITLSSNMPVSEQDIIKGCRNKDRAMQEQLYRQYYALFFKICMRYAKGQEDAQQLINDGFLKIFTNIASYKNEGSFEGWMKRIVVNTCLDYLRSKDLKIAMQMHVNADLVQDNVEAADVNGLKKLEFQDLLRLIQELPPMTRTVFNLYIFDGFSHKEIAKMVDISEGTSSWHVSNARTQLQKKLKLTNLEKSFYEKRV